MQTVAHEHGPRAASGRVVALPAAVRSWVTAHGLPRYRAEQILTWIYHRRVTDSEAMTDLPRALRTEFAAAFEIPHLQAEHVSEARDGTRKLLFRLADDCAIESVLIPGDGRLTVCVSTQAGCGMGCRFCATARLGLQRQLAPHEIVGQVLACQRLLLERSDRRTPRLGVPKNPVQAEEAVQRPSRSPMHGQGEMITNVVLMGMGEPLQNYHNVVAALEILSAPWGLAISARRVTVSTIGLLPELERLVRDTNVNVAVSLSATTDEQRERLIPVSRKHSLSKLLEVCRSLPIAHRRRITFEYVMLAGVNDSVQDADRLVKLLHGIRSKVNLIPFNPFPGAAFSGSPEGVIEDFRRRLESRGVLATIRQSRGQDIDAACGQLAARSRV